MRNGFGQELKNYYIDLEFSVLGAMNWKPNVVTPNEFLNLLLQRGVLTTNDFVEGFSVEFTKVYAECLFQLALNMALQLSLHHRMYDFKPFVIAMSIISCARRFLRLNSWSYELYCLTGFNLQQFEDIIEYVDEILNSCPFYQQWIILVFCNEALGHQQT